MTSNGMYSPGTHRDGSSGENRINLLHLCLARESDTQFQRTHGYHTGIGATTKVRGCDPSAPATMTAARPESVDT